MASKFYKAFQDKYRGSRDLIKSRLQVYLPFVEEIKKLHPEGCTALDLGCGRGEWLEVLIAYGVEAHGIDFDDYMLVDCRELGLSVETGDAVTFLADLSDESFDLVSGFHIAEHLSFADLQRLVCEALRVLKPGGLLILETPNPENVVVGTSSFFLDPTHVRPIPPQLLSFLPEYYGFFRVKILRLQEAADLLKQREPTLQDVLGGASPDFSVVAQKDAALEILAPFDGLFQQEYGLSLEMLANRYEKNIQLKLSATAQFVDELVRQTEARVQELNRQAAAAEERAQQTETRAVAAETQCAAIVRSRSWRVTTPLRLLGRMARRKKGGAK